MVKQLTPEGFQCSITHVQVSKRRVFKAHGQNCGQFDSKFYYPFLRVILASNIMIGTGLFATQTLQNETDNFIIAKTTLTY